LGKKKKKLFEARRMDGFFHINNNNNPKTKKTTLLRLSFMIFSDFLTMKLTFRAVMMARILNIKNRDAI